MEVLEREKSEKEALSIGLTWSSGPVKDSPQSLREYRFQGEDLLQVTQLVGTTPRSLKRTEVSCRW